MSKDSLLDSERSLFDKLDPLGQEEAANILKSLIEGSGKSKVDYTLGYAEKAWTLFSLWNSTAAYGKIAGQIRMGDFIGATAGLYEEEVLGKIEGAVLENTVGMLKTSAENKFPEITKPLYTLSSSQIKEFSAWLDAYENKSNNSSLLLRGDLDDHNIDVSNIDSVSLENNSITNMIIFRNSIPPGSMWGNEQAISISFEVGSDIQIDAGSVLNASSELDVIERQAFDTSMKIIESTTPTYRIIVDQGEDFGLWDPKNKKIITPEEAAYSVYNRSGEISLSDVQNELKVKEKTQFNLGDISYTSSWENSSANIVDESIRSNQIANIQSVEFDTIGSVSRVKVRLISNVGVDYSVLEVIGGDGNVSERIRLSPGERVDQSKYEIVSKIVVNNTSEY